MKEPSDDEKKLHFLIDGIKDHLKVLGEHLPAESMRSIELRLSDAQEMMFCYRDPRTGELICR